MSNASATVDTVLAQAEACLAQTVWPQFEATAYTVTERILAAFQQHRVGEEHFYSVTGYGHNDLGREVLDRVFASALQAPAALVRPQFASGTHTLSVALKACLGPADRLCIVTGTPYDTLHPVLGHPVLGKNPEMPHPASLAALGVVLDVVDGLSAPLESFSSHIQAATVVYIQRSKGYGNRRSLTINELAQWCATITRLNPQAVILVDNCYGEFVEAQEPTAVGAHLMAGSLIKNPGGGLALCGGYIAGQAQWVERAAAVLTCPGVSADGGYMFDQTRTLLMGLFLAPSVVKEALKGMSVLAYLFAQAGYGTQPAYDAFPRGDIIQLLELGSPEALQQFCQLVQACSPISHYVRPEPAVVPGYADAVVMAGGTFIDGSSIELSADGPMRPPYLAFVQGGLTYAHTRILAKRWLAASL